MTIKKISRLINVLTICVIAVAAWSLFNLSQRGADVANANHIRFYSIYLVNELRGSSEELTRQVRNYAVTGDPAAEAAYNMVLAVRGGLEPRPTTALVAPGQRRVLLDLLREHGVTDAEFILVERANMLSDNLVGLEITAMNAVKGIFADAQGQYTIHGDPDRELALSLVFGPMYDNEVRAIMAPMIEFEEQVNQRTNKMVEEAVQGQQVAELISFIALALVLASAIFNLLFNTIVIIRPLQTVIAVIKTVSTDGKMHLDRRIYINGKNEIGEMADFFNKTFESIASLVKVIKNKSAELITVGNNLSSNMNEAATAVNQITDNVNNIKNQVAAQSTSVSQTNSTMDLLASTIRKLSDHVNNQSTHVSGVSSAIEEMVSSIRSVTNTLVKNETNVKTLLESSDAGRSGLQDVVQDIQEIAHESEGLLEINAVIENIASQTNLLSMNAAIEAAHAGDAGRGFAVVADEIRKLSESSSEQSKTISTVLKKMKDSVDKITRSTEKVLTKFEAIDSSVKTVTEQEEVIRNSMEEQQAGSRQVLEAISSVVGITQQVSVGSDEMFKGVNEVIQECKNLERTTQDITKMTYGTDQIDAVMSKTNSISVVNRNNIEALMKEVSRFNVD